MDFTKPICAEVEGGDEAAERFASYLNLNGIKFTEEKDNPWFLGNTRLFYCIFNNEEELRKANSQEYALFYQSN